MIGAPEAPAARLPWLPGRWMAQRARVPLASVVLSLFVGYALSHGELVVAFAPAALVAVVLLSSAAWLPYAVVLLTVASVAEPGAYPQFAFGGVSVFLSELILGLALVAALLVPKTGADNSHKPQTIGIALTLFLFSAGIGITVAHANGFGLVAAFNFARDAVWFPVFWLALVGLSSPAARAALVRVVIPTCFVVVALQVAQVVVGEGTLLFFARDPKAELTICPIGQCAHPGAEGFIRVQPPGLRLVYVTCAFAACYLLFGPRRRRGVALLTFAVCLAGSVLSFNRNEAVGLALGLCAALLAVPRKGRLVPAITVATATVLVLVVAAGSGLLHPAAPVISRFATLADPSSHAATGSLQDRFYEDRLALRALRHHPLEGIGWGASYGKTTGVLANGKSRLVDQPFIHNFYLGLWLHTGLLGLVSFLVIIAAALVYGVRWCRRRALDDRTWLGAAVIASVVAVSVSASVDVGSDPNKMVPLLAVFALAVILAGEMRREQGTEEIAAPGGKQETH